MTVADIESRIKAIADMADRHDYETAHVYEDILYKDVLQEIADFDYIILRSPTELAQAALKSKDIKFNRFWSE